MIRAIESSDIAGLNSLPPKDWQFDYEDFLIEFLNEEFFAGFILIKDNRIAGTGNVLLMDNIGWLANIIVVDEFRGQGLGTQITQFLIEYLIRKGCETQLLVATELGEPVYTKLGFEKLTDYICFDSIVDVEISPSPAVKKLTSRNLNQVCDLDKLINDENRKHLITRYFEGGLGYFNDKTLVGVYLQNFGRGLILATEERAGLELLRIKHSKKDRRTLLPLENKSGVQYLKSLGLIIGDPCSKMVYGKKNLWKPEFVFSYASGYCG